MSLRDLFGLSRSRPDPRALARWGGAVIRALDRLPPAYRALWGAQLGATAAELEEPGPRRVVLALGRLAQALAGRPAAADSAL